MVKLGKLKQLGISELDQLALYMPTDFVDYSYPITYFDPQHLVSGVEYLFSGTLQGQPTTSFKKGQPMTKLTITDGIGTLKFTLFGDTRELIAALTAENAAVKPIHVFGQYVWSNGSYINGAKIIPEDLIGKVHPVYPGVAGKMKPETVASHIAKHIDASIPLAADKVRAFLVDKFPDPRTLRQYLNATGLTLEHVLTNIHRPTQVVEARHCLDIASRIAGIVAADDLIKKAKLAKNIKLTQPLYGPDISHLLQDIPFKPTDEQLGIVARTLQKIASGHLNDILLIGDVGTGKSVVYFMIAAYIAYAGGRVAIMLPNGNLANQIYSELKSYYQDLNPLLVMGDNEHSDDDMISAKILVGTTALLFRDIGKLDLCIFDESQKMAVSQQQQLISEHTHKISVSATPIPRTMALGQYGAVTVEKITICHAQKTIYTRVLQQHNYSELISEVLWTINQSGKQALIVCARKEDAITDSAEEGATTSELLSVEQVYAEFEALLPGAVAISHSGLTPEQNAEALQSMRDGTKQLLIATTVIEVGVTLPDLAYAAVFDADRFGLSQLHQIRGRLVRKGGEGWFTLYINRQVKNPKTIERMNILADSNDGFYIAKRDLELRGLGDINNGTKQHGAYIGLIRNVEVDIDSLDQILNHFT